MEAVPRVCMCPGNEWGERVDCPKGENAAPCPKCEHYAVEPCASGPWEYVYCTGINHRYPHIIRHAEDWGIIAYSTEARNSFLLAAAPELLEALEWIAHCAVMSKALDYGDLIDMMKKKARAAIAKARGGVA